MVNVPAFFSEREFEGSIERVVHGQHAPERKFSILLAEWESSWHGPMGSSPGMKYNTLIMTYARCTTRSMAGSMAAHNAFGVDAEVSDVLAVDVGQERGHVAH